MSKVLVVKGSGTVSAEIRVSVDDLPTEETARANAIEELSVQVQHDLAAKAGAIKVTAQVEDA